MLPGDPRETERAPGPDGPLGAADRPYTAVASSSGEPRRSARRHGRSWFGARGNRRRSEVSSAKRTLAAIRRQARTGLVLCLFVGLSGAAVGLGRFVFRSPHFAVRTLRLAPTRHVAAETLAVRVQSVLGMNLFRVDLDAVRRDLAEEPWVADVHVRRELPSTIAVDIVERDAACAVVLGSIYLVDASGQVFKRASAHEALGLPVVTGIDRARYLGDPASVSGDLRVALSIAAAWRAAPRPPIGELHVDRDRCRWTLYTAGGLGVGLGLVETTTLPAQLARFDVVSHALEKSGGGDNQARFIHLDNRNRPDRVTVKLAHPPHANSDGDGNVQPEPSTPTQHLPPPPPAPSDDEGTET